jgi:hypothetical protein
VFARNKHKNLVGWIGLPNLRRLHILCKADTNIKSLHVTTFRHTTQEKLTNTVLPPAALPLPSMETYAMDPNCSAMAPYEPSEGAQCMGSGSLQRDPSIGAPQWHPVKNWEMDGESALGGCHSMEVRNNQPNNYVGGGWDFGEVTQSGGTCGGGHLAIIWGGQIERRKNKKKRAKGPWFSMASSGWGETTTNQESAQSTE